MRIAMVFDGLGFGGIERVGSTYARILVDAGCEVTIINLQSSANELENLFPAECQIVEASLPDVCLPDRYLPMVRRWRWGKYVYPAAYLASSAALHATKMVSREDAGKSFDVAIAFSGHIRDLSYVAYGFVRARKTIAWLHGSFADYMILSYSFGDLYRRIGTLCAVSTENQEYVFNACHYLRDEVAVNYMPNPLPPSGCLDADKVAELQSRYGRFLLMVARFGKDKDQATVLKSLANIRNRSGLEIPTVFVGDGEMLPQCRELAADLGIADQVYFEGAHTDVGEYYKAATVGVLSSPAEGMPMVLLEAMSSGLPIVATRSLPGVPQLLGDDEYGLLCAVGDEADMADKLYAMWTDEDLRNHYRAQGLRRAADFSADSVGEKLMAVLKA